MDSFVIFSGEMLDGCYEELAEISPSMIGFFGVGLFKSCSDGLFSCSFEELVGSSDLVVAVFCMESRMESRLIRASFNFSSKEELELSESSL